MVKLGSTVLANGYVLCGEDSAATFTFVGDGNRTEYSSFDWLCNRGSTWESAACSALAESGKTCWGVRLSGLNSRIVRHGTFRLILSRNLRGVQIIIAQGFLQTGSVVLKISSLFGVRWGSLRDIDNLPNTDSIFTLTRSIPAPFSQFDEGRATHIPVHPLDGHRAPKAFWHCTI
jgi:hypothetical protein